MNRVVFMGTPAMAVPCLKALKDNGYDILMVVSQPDKPKGRGNVMQPTPVKEYALLCDIKVYQPEKVRNNLELIALLKDLAPDFLVVVAYGKILPQVILDIPKHAPINVHYSLLPLYRGAAPVNWAVINGDEFTGVTTMKMDIGMDTGDILLVDKTAILKKTAVDLSNELSIKGADLLIKTLKDYSVITPLKQEHNKATVAPMLKKDDGQIDWTESAVVIERKIRGFQPWPTAFTSLGGKLLKIFEADISLGNDGKVGTVMNVDKGSFSIATGKDALIVKELQLEGKKRMKSADFLAGYKLQKGVQIG